MTKNIKILTLVSLFITSLIFTSCSSESNNLELEENSNTEKLKIFLNQNFDTSNSDFEVLEVEDKNTNSSNFMNDIISRNSNSDMESFYMKIDSKTEEGIVEFNTVTTDVTSDGNNEYMTTYTEFSNENGFTETYKMVLKKTNDEQFEIFDFSVVNTNGVSTSSIANRGWWSDFSDCIGGVLDTDESLGQTITVLGIAGGAGCVPCGIAGGVIFGFAALGCSAV
jgi:hypothetical protein